MSHLRAGSWASSTSFLMTTAGLVPGEVKCWALALAGFHGSLGLIQGESWQSLGRAGHKPVACLKLIEKRGSLPYTSISCGAKKSSKGLTYRNYFWLRKSLSCKLLGRCLRMFVLLLRFSETGDYLVSESRYEVGWTSVFPWISLGLCNDGWLSWCLWGSFCLCNWVRSGRIGSLVCSLIST